ncbi:MAG: DEAD/DEAH box helicase [Oceanospirillaceae bacterium]|jgi:ATP-dependent RNA helicase DeaD|nr:DEAD/DEAH box helicase [Oceanospirillaceae bacterium]MBT4444042.1 DEAD/DEAH box helicase [Oceanospirillaceae bacterium]MBT6077128.1 DEAD/DEAH box helicase [Oceanospirillaceae bacterium]MBT7330087.1 DEAD/DEAH box helicase [Oceanospirillaceae bacterium]
MTTFSELALSKPVLSAITRIGYEQPSPIQAAAIPHLLEGKDILGTAQTGTGKTAAFALPALSNIDLKVEAPQVLVLAPTRELAIQVSEAFQNYASDMRGFHVLPIYGGSSMSGQLRQLQRGVHVVVGTPGRVMDHLRRGTLKLDKLKTVVLDEADEMLRMGFIDDVTWILDHTPAERQVALFSATMPAVIRKVANTYLNNPEVIKIEAKTATVDSVTQRYWKAVGTNKLDAMTRILEAEDFDGVIVFVRTKTLTVELAEKLEARGHRASAINGDMSQQLRERTIEHLKKSKIDIVVATDVAARGIDVARVSHVINYDIPYDTEAYVHRIGRTGRAGRTGSAILFVAPRERNMLRSIEKATRQTITPMELPSREQVQTRRIDQFKASIDKALEQSDLSIYSDLIEAFVKEREIAPEQVAAALAFMAQQDRPLVMEEPRKPERRDSRDATPGFGDEERRPRRERKEETFSGESIAMERFRIEVGHDHQVKPGDIVGAIANEADLSSAYIGRINLLDDHSTVDLPAGMPAEMLQLLKKVRVRNQPLNIESQGAADDFVPGAKSPRPKRKGPPNRGGDRPNNRRDSRNDGARRR